ncbi:unnamed protein product, partial [Hapterophycus canaliculatus]
RCPTDCRRAVAQNVVVAGGGAMLPGLCARLAQEIEALTADPGARAGAGAGAGADAAPARAGSGGYSWARACGNGLRVVKVPVRRDHLVWTGASIMASLGGMAQRCLTSEQYLARDAGGAEGGGGGRLPDWMSVAAKDWLFEAPAPVPTA